METVCLHDKAEIEVVLRRNTFLNIYTIGDLDAPYWDHTTWYGLREQGRIGEVVLIYTGTSTPVLLSLSDEPAVSMQELLTSIVPYLPRRFNAHLSGGLSKILEEHYRVRSFGPHLKMALVDRSRISEVDVSEAVPVSISQLAEVQQFYSQSYPDNWFEPQMLANGHFYGIWRNGVLASMAGVHVYSEQYRVAALANIATHPDFRGQGLARAACAKLCGALLGVDHIGLNVGADNDGAIALYRRLGFETIAEYGEYAVELQ